MEKRRQWEGKNTVSTQTYMGDQRHSGSSLAKCCSEERMSVLNHSIVGFSLLLVTS